MREVLNAVVSSRLPKARAVSLTQVQGVMRKPVTGDANAEWNGPNMPLVGRYNPRRRDWRNGEDHVAHSVRHVKVVARARSVRVWIRSVGGLVPGRATFFRWLRATGLTVRQSSASTSVVRSTWRNRPNFEVCLVVIAVVAICLAFSFVGFYLWDTLNEGESVSATLRNLSLVSGAFIAIVLSLWRSTIANRQAVAAHKQVEIGLQQAATAQEGLLCDRFQRAAEMLGHDVVAVRIGGVQALSELAVQNMDRYYITVANLLTAFTMCPPDAGSSSDTDWSDVQVATDAIGMLRELREGRIEVSEVFDLVPHQSSLGRHRNP